MRKTLYVTVFFSGMTTLAVELSASRLLGNFFGTSNLVWASIIGLILIYLTAGYFLGGYWADRSPHYSTLFKILCWGAFSVGLIPLASRPILRMAANAFDQLQLGALVGSFVSVMILFIIPVTLLGTASPFAIRLMAEDTQQLGGLSGRISAISTIGSFIGTFLPSLLLTPTIGTYRTFLTFSGLLLLVALYGLGRSTGWKTVLSYSWMAVVILILALVGTRGSDKNTTGMIYESESAYNYIQVIQEGEYRMLRLNDGQGVHSIYHPTKLSYAGPWEQVLVAPFFNPAPYSPAQVKRMAIVGLAAGTTARQATAVYGDIAIDGIEIDPEIVAVGRKYFDMNQPNLNVITQDGRWGLEHSTQRYQIISVDAYRPPYIPAHLTTREFFQIARQHLSDDGVLVINVGRAPSDRRMINALGATLATVFPTLHVVDIPNTFNSVIFATAQPTHSDNLLANYLTWGTNGKLHPLLRQAMETAIANRQPPPPPGVVFSDDIAPVEWITNNMVLNFLFSGNMEQLQ